MKWVIILSFALTVPNLPYKYAVKATDIIPERINNIPIELYGILEVAEMKTGAPKDILAGIVFAETSFDKNFIHPNKLDKGLFGLHETIAIRNERIRKYGFYDPENIQEAAIIAGYLYRDNLLKLKNKEKAIAAHFQGICGVRENGINYEYVNKVLSIGGTR
jgi:hypothetical protein